MISDPFHWLALAGTVALFWIVPANLRHPALALASFAFLFSLDGPLLDGSDGWIPGAWATKNRIALICLLLLSLVVYGTMCRLARLHRIRPFALPGIILLLIGYLAYHKYVPAILAYLGGKPLDSEIVIPLGISYFSFKLIHYAIEASRGTFREHRFSEFASYIFLFPIFSAGPIERFDHYTRNQAGRLAAEDIVTGVTRICHGLVKKFVFGGAILAGIVQQFTADELVRNIGSVSALEVWMFLIVSYLIIYMDFSGYSDIAIGSSRLFGIRIMENFNWPIRAENVGAFWKRWHMTLANWCQSYIYMPAIGYTRQPYVAVLLTFFVIGIWHAASLNFIAWGLFHGAGVSCYFAFTRFVKRRGLKLPRAGIMRHWGVPPTFLFISASFAFTMTHESGDPAELHSALRILAKCIGIDLA